MSISPVGVSHTRYQVMDFSSPLYMDETSVIYTKPTPEPDVTGFIKPYAPLVILTTYYTLNLLTLVFVHCVSQLSCFSQKLRVTFYNIFSLNCYEVIDSS